MAAPRRGPLKVLAAAAGGADKGPVFSASTEGWHSRRVPGLVCESKEVAKDAERSIAVLLPGGGGEDGGDDADGCAGLATSDEAAAALDPVDGEDGSGKPVEEDTLMALARHTRFALSIRGVLALPEDLPKLLPSLRTLNLQSIAFTAFPATAEFTRLMRLNLCGTRVEEIGDWVGEMRSLVKLEAYSMRSLRRLSPRIRECSRLRTIVVSANSLKELPADLITSLPVLRGLYIYDNQLSMQSLIAIFSEIYTFAGCQLTTVWCENQKCEPEPTEAEVEEFLETVARALRRNSTLRKLDFNQLSMPAKSPLEEEINSALERNSRGEEPPERFTLTKSAAKR